MAIGDIKNRLRAKFTRRYSTASSISQSSADGEAQSHTQAAPAHAPPRSLRSLRLRSSTPAAPSPSTAIVGVESSALPEALPEEDAGHDGAGDKQVVVVDREAGAQLDQATRARSDRRDTWTPATSSSIPPPSRFHELEGSSQAYNPKHDSSSTADFPTPSTDIAPVREVEEEGEENVEENGDDDDDKHHHQHHQHHQDELERVEAEAEAEAETEITRPDIQPAPSKRPPQLSRRQSLLPPQQTRLIKTLLETEELAAPAHDASLDYFTSNGPTTISAPMGTRKIWVKRAGASATLVAIHEDDLVDDVRDMILKKYANSLGRNFDAPDVTLRIVPREQRQERALGPEEPMGRTLDAYFPGGQTVDEALVIDVPLRRTPKPSPQPHYHRAYYDETRPTEAGSDYFPPMPVPAASSPHLPASVPVGVVGQGTALHHAFQPHSMSILTTGHVPALPSPGSTSRRIHRDRPRIGRQHTSSPTVISSLSHQPTASNGTQVHRGAPRSRTHSSASESNAAPVPPPLPTPPAVQPALDIVGSQVQRVATPPPIVSSPRPPNRAKKSKKASDHPSLPAGMLNGAVPPINVLIVEDNIINLKLLEAFMKRLKVRWQTAMNGREAVNKWRGGGFHLVLMDIQLPIMSGLEATKEIRRLERLNSIGVFSSSASSSAPEHEADEAEGEDKLPTTVLFKSPVIIVALTASSLQSDRHEALAAGCNDFLTKPVNFVWLERKVMEWGCMQALIDFDGWRKWKDFSQQADVDKDNKKALTAKKKKNRNSLGASAVVGPGANARGLVGVREEAGAERVAVS